MVNLKGVRVFVTGATGYIGSSLTKRLVKEGSSVHVLVRSASNKHGLREVIDQITEHVYDGTYQSIDQAIRDSKPEIVIHLSSFASISYETKDVPAMLESNIVFGTYLAEAMANHKVTNLLNTGSFAQHFQQEDYYPNSLYAATKQAYEDVLLYYTKHSILNSITLVLFDNFGPNDPRPKIMNLLYRSMKDGTTLLMSPGEQWMDLLYIDDVIEAYIQAASLLMENKVLGSLRYAVGSEKLIQLNKLVLLMEQLSGEKIRVKWGARDYRSGEIMIPWRKGVPLPGWKQSIPLEQAIDRFIKENDQYRT